MMIKLVIYKQNGHTTANYDIVITYMENGKVMN